MHQQFPFRSRLFSLAVAGLCLAAAHVNAAEFEWRNDPDVGHCDLYDADQPVVRYVYGVDESTSEAAFDTAKVFHHVFGPGTEQLITKGPGGKYPHHRGLYVGWNRTSYNGKTADFWHCRKGERQRHVEFVQLAGDNEQAIMSARIHWIDPQGTLVIEETRTIAVRPLESSVNSGWQIDWQTQLDSKVGEVKLDGDRQHAGFQFRAAQTVADENSARYIRPEGHPEQPEAFQVNDRTNPDEHVDLGWLAMTFPLDSNRYTVEYFEDPDLPGPSRYSERPYGRFGAFFTTTLTESVPLTMWYRLNVTKGDPPSRDAIQARYAAFAAEVRK